MKKYFLRCMKIAYSSELKWNIKRWTSVTKHNTRICIFCKHASDISLYLKKSYKERKEERRFDN